jgi:hypothetical protein
MAKRPGFGSLAAEGTRPGSPAESPTWLESAGRAVDNLKKEVKETYRRTIETWGTSIVGKPAIDYYDSTGLAQEFTDSEGTLHRHQNPVDAFRHSYTSGVIADWTGGEWAVDIGTFFGESEDNPAGRMDIHNNTLGARLALEFEQKHGRSPNDDERMVTMVDAILDGRLVIRTEGSPGWRDRLRETTQPQRDQMIERIWHERRERAEREHRGDPLSPRELERGERHRPGFGDHGKTMDA